MRAALFPLSGVFLAHRSQERHLVKAQTLDALVSLQQVACPYGCCLYSSLLCQFGQLERAAQERPQCTPATATQMVLSGGVQTLCHEPERTEAQIIQWQRQPASGA